MPHAYHVDMNAFAEALTGTIATFGFTATHEGRALGELIVDNVVEGIALRSIERQCGGDGVRWPLNSDARRREKFRRMGQALTNVDTGQMLSAKSLRGTTKITQHMVTMDYGTNTPMNVPDRLPATQRIVVLGGIAKERVTDVDKAYYALIQGRSFFELDDNFKSFSTTLAAHLANPGR